MSTPSKRIDGRLIGSHIAGDGIISNYSNTTGDVNYSPKHGNGRSVTSNPRNINFKNLQLDISPSRTTNETDSSRAIPLTLTIPDELSPKYRNLNGSPTISLPKYASSEASLPSSKIVSQVLSPQNSKVSPLPSSEQSSSLQSPFASYLSHETPKSKVRHATKHPDPLCKNNPLFTDYSSAGNSLYPHVSNKSINAREFDSISNQPKLHEELQESTAVNAYPDGPANVLDSNLFLYSDPFLSEKIIDINEYDLVLNVAKECKNLQSEYNTRGGSRKYVHIPWSHTSSILEQLPELTKQLSEMDVAGKKSLIHCQCGVLRSACVVVAYFMVKFDLSVNEAYELLKTGTKNKSERVNSLIGDRGHFVQACEKICPNMNLIFELMDFGEKIKESQKD